MTTSQIRRQIQQAIKERINQQPLWDLDIKELSGHNIESAGREEVNKMLDEGWILLHVYTLKYREGNVWRERPMAILGRR